MEKITYAPSEAKRFEISKDKYSRERIQALNDIYRQLSRRLPFSIAFSLYGSLSKSKYVSAYSDIDIVIFIDEDEFNRNFYQFIYSRPEFAKLYS